MLHLPVVEYKLVLAYPDPELENHILKQEQLEPCN